MKNKRKRIETKPVELRLKEIKATLGITKFEDKWNAICNEVKMLKFVA